MLNNQVFYNNFHKNTTYQLRPIKNNNFTYNSILKNLNEVLLKLPSNSRILDYGCGAGTLSLYLASKGYKVTGIDISPKAINEAKTSAKIMGLNNICFLTLKEIKLLTKLNYDLILCVEVIEHIKDDKSLLDFLSSILKPKGYLFLSTPSKNAPLFRLHMLDGFDKNVGHIRRYSIGEVSYKIIKTGFQIIKISYEEGIIRNSLYTLKPLKGVTKFVRGPIAIIITFLDKISVKLFGESNLHILSQKP